MFVITLQFYAHFLNSCYWLSFNDYNFSKSSLVGRAPLKIIQAVLTTMQSMEDLRMLDVPTSTDISSSFSAKNNLQYPGKFSNGIPRQIIAHIDQISGVSRNSSRETSVLAREANQLSLGSPFESTSSSDDGRGTEDQAHTEPLPYYVKKTGLCYDARMRFHTELAPPKDRSDYHPEDPRRILHIYRELCEAGLVADSMAIPPVTSNPVFRILARAAKKTEVCLVHDDAHFEFVKSTSSERA